MGWHSGLEFGVKLALCGGIGFALIAPSTRLHAVPSSPLPVPNASVKVCIQPLGKYDKRLLSISERGITYLYGFEVVRQEPSKMPKQAYNKTRRRWRADTLLEHLESKVWPQAKAKGCDMVMGFTMHDISTTTERAQDWGILGLAQLKGHVGVVSSYRTGRKLKAPHTRARRTVKVINHEIGHILGIPHVSGAGCLMNDAEGSVLTTDQETGLLCPKTTAWIESNMDLTLPKHDSFEWELVEGGK